MDKEASSIIPVGVVKPTLPEPLESHNSSIIMESSTFGNGLETPQVIANDNGINKNMEQSVNEAIQNLAPHLANVILAALHEKLVAPAQVQHNDAQFQSPTVRKLEDQTTQSTNKEKEPEKSAFKQQLLDSIQKNILKKQEQSEQSAANEKKDDESKANADHCAPPPLPPPIPEGLNLVPPPLVLKKKSIDSPGNESDDAPKKQPAPALMSELNKLLKSGVGLKKTPEKATKKEETSENQNFLSTLKLKSRKPAEGKGTDPKRSTIGDANKAMMEHIKNFELKKNKAKIGLKEQAVETKDPSETEDKPSHCEPSKKAEKEINNVTGAEDTDKSFLPIKKMPPKVPKKPVVILSSMRANENEIQIKLRSVTTTTTLHKTKPLLSNEQDAAHNTNGGQHVLKMKERRTSQVFTVTENPVPELEETSSSPDDNNYGINNKSKHEEADADANINLEVSSDKESVEVLEEKSPPASLEQELECAPPEVKGKVEDNESRPTGSTQPPYVPTPPPLPPPPTVDGLCTIKTERISFKEQTKNTDGTFTTTTVVESSVSASSTDSGPNRNALNEAIKTFNLEDLNHIAASLKGGAKKSPSGGKSELHSEIKGFNKEKLKRVSLSPKEMNNKFRTSIDLASSLKDSIAIEIQKRLIFIQGDDSSDDDLDEDEWEDEE